MGGYAVASGTMKAEHMYILIIFFVDLFVDGIVSTAQSTVFVKAVNNLHSRSSLWVCYGE
jgi:hypothetical protein